MLWMTPVMKVPAGYGTVSDWGKPELGLRIIAEKPIRLVLEKECDGQRRRWGAEPLLK